MAQLAAQPLVSIRVQCDRVSLPVQCEQGSRLLWLRVEAIAESTLQGHRYFPDSLGLSDVVTFIFYKCIKHIQEIYP